MEKNGLKADDLRELAAFLEAVRDEAHYSSGKRSINGAYTQVRLVGLDETKFRLCLEDGIQHMTDREVGDDCNACAISVPRKVLADSALSLEEKAKSLSGWEHLGREKTVTSEEVDEEGVSFTRTVTETWKAPGDEPDDEELFGAD